MNNKEKGNLVLLRLAYYNDHTGPKQRSLLPSGLQWHHQCAITEACYYPNT